MNGRTAISGGQRENGNLSVQLDLSSLSTRERDVLALLGQGLSRAEIARRLYRSPKTIDNHCTRIYDKLGVHTQAQLVRLLHEQGLVGELTGEGGGVGTPVDARIWRAHEAIERELGQASAEDYFDVVTRALCDALDLEMAGISELDEESREFVVLAAHVDGQPAGQMFCPVEVSPCTLAMKDGSVACIGDVLEQYPDDEPLVRHEARSYIGVGLHNHWMGNLGTMWVASRKPIEHRDVVLGVLRLLRAPVGTAMALQIAVDRLSEVGSPIQYRSNGLVA